MMKILVLFFVILTVSSCSHYPQANGLLTLEQSVYRLRENDVIHLRVYDEPEFNGEFKIDSQGRVALPLAGKVNIRNMTEQEAAKAIQNHLTGTGMLKNPKVSIEIAKARPFFILGEVQKSGQFPFHSGLTVYQAVAIAGGYTYRADRNDIVIRRQESKSTGNEKRYSATEDTPILPGDAIEIGERFF